MGVIVVLVLFSLMVALFFLGAFYWAVKTGQFDDSETPSIRMLFDDEISQTQNVKSGTEISSDGLNQEILFPAPPIANDDLVNIDEDNVAQIILDASDPDGDPLTYQIDNNPTNGIVTLIDNTTGEVEYEPNLNFNGVDSFTCSCPATMYRPWLQACKHIKRLKEKLLLP